MESLSSLKSTTILLPAAGWGSRMGYPNAKEILVNPQTGRPFIQYALESIQNMNAHCVVITRSEKKDLLVWLNDYQKKNSGMSIETYLVACTQEWPDTLLKTKSIWTDYNIVLLPDTDWKPKMLAQKIEKQLEVSPLVYGVFAAKKNNWGFVKSDAGELSLVEKPTGIPLGFKAWGAIGFRKEVGEEILLGHLQSTQDHKIKKFAIESGLIELEDFNDRTRGEATL